MRFLQKDMVTRATSRRHVITIIRISRENVSGDVEVREDIVTKCWASVKPLSEAQRVKYQGISVMASHTISIDGAIDVREDTDLILFEGRRFEILTIRNVDEINRDKIIITQEIRPGQNERNN